MGELLGPRLCRCADSNSDTLTLLTGHALHIQQLLLAAVQQHHAHVRAGAEEEKSTRTQTAQVPTKHTSERKMRCMIHTCVDIKRK